jgi:hypothetical protein
VRLEGLGKLEKIHLIGIQSRDLPARAVANSLMSNVWPDTSQTRSVFASSNTGIVGWNPTQCMDVCVRLFCVYVAAL